MNKMDPKGKVALVTGGAAGIGLAVAKELLQQGVKGVSVCDVDVTNGQKEVKQLNQQFAGKAIFIRTDVSKEDDVEGAFKQTINSFGGLDIIINNAGIFDERNWERCISINLNGVIRTTLLAFKYMGKNRGGKGGVVVNTASIAGLGGGLKMSAIYNTSKHAVVGLTRSYGSEYVLSTTGVRIIAVCPGFTETSILDFGEDVAIHEDWKQEIVRELSLIPPVQSAEHVGKAVVQMIREAKNGALWVSDLSEPPYEVNIPPYSDLRA